MVQQRRINATRGSLLGGGYGDALGAPIEFDDLKAIRTRHGLAGPVELEIGAQATDDTQMTLFTAEGLIRGMAAELPPEQWRRPVWRAYRRWLHTQGVPWDEVRTAADPPRPDGWLVSQRMLFARRAPGATCLSALAAGVPGLVDAPVNDSKGCGGVMRAAPAGLVGLAPADAFRVGADVAALTHGHPSGFLAAGVLAATVTMVLDGAELADAVTGARGILRTCPGHTEVDEALDAAIRTASRGPLTPEIIEADLGAGWVAEEALAIAVAAALAPDALWDPVGALRDAVTHSGDSDSTGSIAGNLLGALLGEAAWPASWRSRLDLADPILRVADDLAVAAARRDGAAGGADVLAYPAG